jgi:signal transduction histidine kinase
MHAGSGFEGHGLGLATVRRVVERHGGQIWAESRPEMGTTIKFTLAEHPAGNP